MNSASLVRLRSSLCVSALPARSGPHHRTGPARHPTACWSVPSGTRRRGQSL